jgi:hypothetical protein
MDFKRRAKPSIKVILNCFWGFVKLDRRVVASAFGAPCLLFLSQRRKGAKLAKGREGVFVSKRGVILSGIACIQQPLFLSLP